MAPGNLQSTLLLADCDLRLGQNKSVIALLRPLEQENAGNLAVVYLLSMALIRDGEVQEGQRLVDEILRQGDSAEARFLLGSQMFASVTVPVPTPRHSRASRSTARRC